MKYKFMIEAYMVADMIPIGEGTLKEGAELVKALEARYEKWEEDGNPELPKGDPLQYFEGCEIVAVNDEGKVKFYYADEWEPM